MIPGPFAKSIDSLVSCCSEFLQVFYLKILLNNPYEEVEIFLA